MYIPSGLHLCLKTYSGVDLLRLMINEGAPYHFTEPRCVSVRLLLAVPRAAEWSFSDRLSVGTVAEEQLEIGQPTIFGGQQANMSGSFEGILCLNPFLLLHMNGPTLSFLFNALEKLYGHQSCFF